MILIDALYINQSGGKILLEYLIEQIHLHHDIHQFKIVLDRRLVSTTLNLIPQHNKIILNSSELDRKAIYATVLKANNVTCIFCFNNIPPPVTVKNIPVYIYFHNVLLIDAVDTKHNLYQKLLFYLKSTYIYYKNNHNYHWLVQSDLVRQKLAPAYNILQENIGVMPFYTPLPPCSESVVKQLAFIYPADGVPQKNHTLLFKVWEELADKYSSYPVLKVTLNPKTYPVYIQEIERLGSKGVKIQNLGVVPHSELLKEYCNCEYLVFPSIRESFGLPLIEAVSLGCKVLAADLPYVKAVIKPSASFAADDTMDLLNLVYKLSKKSLLLNESEIIVHNNILEIIKLFK